MVIKTHNNKLILFSILWFAIGIIPVFISLDSYDVLNEAMMAESWLYLSTIGFFTAFVYTFNKFKKLGKALIICNIIFYSFLTMVNNAYWKNDLVLHKNILEYTPERNYLRINLITSYLNSGLYEKALAEIKKFSLYYQDTPHFYYMWGNYYLSTGRLDMAIDNYHKVLNKDKNFYFAYYDLSICYERLNQLDKAIYFALECSKINPYYLDNLIKIGDLYSKKRQFIEANKYYRMALEIEPDSRLIKEKIKNAK